jgi:probable phosphoglycerate mutase
VSEQATRIIAIRHGETDWNVATRIQGQLDIALNETGHRQARRLAAALADEALDAVYSSDLARARETAQAVARHAGLEVRADTGLRERGFGVFEGLTFTEIEQRFPDSARRWRQRDASFGPDGGETLQAFYQRAVASVATLAAQHRGQHIAVVAHGGVLDALYRAATRVALDAPRTWQVSNASINRLLASEAGFVLVGWDDTCHLDEVAPCESSDLAA